MQINGVGGRRGEQTNSTAAGDIDQQLKKLEKQRQELVRQIAEAAAKRGPKSEAEQKALEEKQKLLEQINDQIRLLENQKSRQQQSVQAAAEKKQAADRPPDAGTTPTTEEQRAQVQGSVEQLNQTAAAFKHAIRFDVTEENQRQQVAVVDTSIDKVVREISPEETLQLARKISDMLGVVLDEKR